MWLKTCAFNYSPMWLIAWPCRFSLRMGGIHDMYRCNLSLSAVCFRVQVPHRHRLAEFHYLFYWSQIMFQDLGSASQCSIVGSQKLAFNCWPYHFCTLLACVFCTTPLAAALHCSSRYSGYHKLLDGVYFIAIHENPWKRENYLPWQSNFNSRATSIRQSLTSRTSK